MIYTNGVTGICVASKCGSQTLSHAGPANGWWEISDARELARVERVHCIARHPVERMLSAWRMYMVRPVIAWQRSQDWSLVYRHLNSDRALPWAKQYRADMAVRPVWAFHHFLRTELEHWLRIEDPHFMSQWHTYRGLHRFTQVQYHRDFTQLQVDLGWRPEHRHRGLWPWQYVTLEDFLTDAPELEHLAEDWLIYDK